MKTIHMPTDPVVTFQVDDSIQIPKVGQILDLKYEEYITAPDEWELALSTLENDALVVDRIEGMKCG
ncbi:hypothetical protein [Algoriphagus persicinus]|uniref:hypothetical protein n=1 Tax=Algoriphagus persicinus TaxID=3108754 RepID=UPI002B37A577|nr:hypothetical protein [Algoriphagus sp. E1-3-M2]MEB2786521.1 hypothetical protein [Algoriphagus sp. E1-3-M2]